MTKYLFLCKISDANNGNYIWLILYGFSYDIKQLELWYDRYNRTINCVLVKIQEKPLAHSNQWYYPRYHWILLGYKFNAKGCLKGVFH